MQTATQSRLNDGPFVYDRTRPPGRPAPPLRTDCDPQELRHYGISMRPLNLPMLYFGGTLQLHAIAGLMYIFTTLNEPDFTALIRFQIEYNRDPKSSLRLSIFTSFLPGEKISVYN